MWHYKCRQKIAGELVEECSKNSDENEMIYNEILDEIPFNTYKKVCGSCTLYIVLFVIFLENKHSCFCLFLLVFKKR